MAMERGLGRSPTFLVGAEKQRVNLEQLQRREQHLEESYAKNKALCFQAGTYQKTHPHKAARGHKDADVTVCAPMLLGVADGVSQIEEFGLDASILPRELLAACDELAMDQLLPDRHGRLEGDYRGPIPLMREAFESTDCLGSTTVCCAFLDNSTRIHGKLHPMIAVLSIGDCELLILRQDPSRQYRLEPVFHTEMQRIDGHAQCPLQVCRLDERIDPGFEESMTVEVIEKGSAVHCVSVYEGDIVVLGSDGVFDNLFIDEVVAICNSMLPPKPMMHRKFTPTNPALLEMVARRVVEECHAKTLPGPGGYYAESPIGKGGKRDDTSCVIGEVIEWSKDRMDYWTGLRRQRQWSRVMTFNGALRGCCDDPGYRTDEEDVPVVKKGNKARDLGRASSNSDSQDEDEEEESNCVVL